MEQVTALQLDHVRAGLQLDLLLRCAQRLHPQPAAARHPRRPCTRRELSPQASGWLLAWRRTVGLGEFALGDVGGVGNPEAGARALIPRLAEDACATTTKDEGRVRGGRAGSLGAHSRIAGLRAASSSSRCGARGRCRQARAASSPAPPASSSGSARLCRRRGRQAPRWWSSRLRAPGRCWFRRQNYKSTGHAG